MKYILTFTGYIVAVLVGITAVPAKFRPYLLCSGNGSAQRTVASFARRLAVTCITARVSHTLDKP